MPLAQHVYTTSMYSIVSAAILSLTLFRLAHCCCDHKQVQHMHCPGLRMVLQRHTPICANTPSSHFYCFNQ